MRQKIFSELLSLICGRKKNNITPHRHQIKNFIILQNDKSTLNSHKQTTVVR